MAARVSTPRRAPVTNAIRPASRSTAQTGYDSEVEPTLEPMTAVRIYRRVKPTMQRDYARLTGSTRGGARKFTEM
jgi:hypothetical protein